MINFKSVYFDFYLNLNVIRIGLIPTNPALLMLNPTTKASRAGCVS